MSKRIHKYTSRRQLEDLLNKNSPGAGDEFEKDAFEGFSTLENKEEAFKLKANLDDKMPSELFNNSEKNSIRYWYAAAGFAFIIGLSIYFSTSLFNSEAQDLAISKNQNEVVPQINSLESPVMPTPEPLSKDDARSASFKAPAPAQTNKPLARSTEQSPSPSPVGKSSDKDTEAEEQSFSSASAGNAIVNNNTTAPVQVQESAAWSGSDEKEGSSEAKVKVAKRFQQSPPSKKRDVAKAEKSEASQTSNINNVFYSDGEAKLYLLLGEQISKEKITGKFDARLLINKKGKVEKAELTNPYELSAEDQKRVLKILEKLDGFKFNSDEMDLGEYKISYK